MMAAFFCALVGLACGSFLNVCITRLPKGESVIAPRSHCRRCGQAIANWDNIPLLSWLLLRGKCRMCGASFSVRYPIVELVTSLLFLMCWFKYGPTLETAASWLFCFLSLGLAIMDAENFLLPDRFTIPGLLLGVLARGWTAAAGRNVTAGLREAGWALLDAGVAAGFLLLVLTLYWLIRRRHGMGLGDVKLMAMLAAWLGLPRSGLAFLLAAIFGAAYGLSLIAAKGAHRRLHQGQLAIPFGAFLSLGGLYSFFLGDRTLRWYMQFFR